MEDLVKPSGRSAWVIASVSALIVLQLAIAGVARYARRHTDSRLADERVLVEGYATQLASTAQRQEEPGQPSKPRWHLDDNVEVAGTLQLVQSLGDVAGVTLSSINAARASAPGRQAFQVSGRGRPEQVCAFLASIEEEERLIVVESGKVVPGGPTEVQFEFGLTTYLKAGGQ